MDNQLIILTATQLKELFFEWLYEYENRNNQKGKEEEELYLNSKETCRLLNISNTTLHDWIKKKKLSPHRMGHRLLFLKSEIMKRIAVSIN